MMAQPAEAQMIEYAQQFRQAHVAVRDQIRKVIVGQEQVIDGILTALFVGGHVLLEGVPGLGKTLMIRTLSQALALKFSRIQFTPDLMPADITGTTIVMESDAEDGSRRRREFQFQPGPIFAQIVLADEINRATPKTQSAMLEAMQEHSVTVGTTTRPMAEPFFVMATQNPIEQEGTYPLPEAQLDRFFFKLLVGHADRKELHHILNRTTGSAEPQVQAVLDAAAIIKCQEIVRHVLIAPHVQDFAVRSVLATHPEGQSPTKMVKQFIRFGASPRAAQVLVLAGKARALVDARAHVSIEDIKAVMLPAMRHRLLLNFEGQAEGITTDMVLTDISDTLPVGKQAVKVK
jgi:MoxR-like ATPase